MKALPHKLRRLPSGEPATEQGQIGEWQLSFNPDDGRFYTERHGTVHATFARLANAVTYVRKHTQ